MLWTTAGLVGVFFFLVSYFLCVFFAFSSCCGFIQWVDFINILRFCILYFLYVGARRKSLSVCCHRVGIISMAHCFTAVISKYL